MREGACGAVRVVNREGDARMLGRIVTCALVTMLAFEFFSMKGSTSDCLAVTLNAGTFVVALVTLVVAYKTYRQIGRAHV